MTRLWIAAPMLLLAACSRGGEDKPADPVALVKLAPAMQGEAAQDIALYGAAEAGPAAKMSLVAPAEAKVAAIDAPAGTTVRQGQIVVRLAPSPTTRSDAAKAASDATVADKALARAIRMRGDGLMSDAEVEMARAAAVAANALRASFADRVGGLALRAPAAGIVDTVSVAVGDLLQPAAAVATVTRSGDVRVRFGVDPDTAQTLRPGMTIRIAGNVARAPVSVAIQSVNANVDTQTKLASIYANVPAGSGLRAGEVVSGSVAVMQTGSALTIPYAALLDDAGQPYVYAVSAGVAHRRDVQTDPATGDRVTIRKGLKPGEQVVVEGGTAVEDGMKVRTR
ncbi:efflux RND transporter periplasmic adaptor subunit [Sphingomonas immobilis]|uniref:Efflux RND transporter periplasmic adaptor subunit n=1 Tax=Sphingomonas immobilis TaxID=3063997 RepID=A0ABT8ZZA4_9SPHN|nr:efflux RND transporter periplasmic adaptor subunit [Sphingomonas sp. CA1-15]MDO7842905.1 efflux RND transporter periplasmic adaptor subunit [Sphingomonas sp. CA1-15]